MSVNLIFAQTRNRFIGKDNQLLFSIPEDMARFKTLTQGDIVIMGRNTWMSLPERFRPLPARTNVVITSRPEDIVNTKHPEEKIPCFSNLREAIDTFRLGTRNIWLIGGEKIYAEGIQYADAIFQTVVSIEKEGDARAPFIDTEVWKIKKLSPLNLHEGIQYQFIDYVRKDDDQQRKEAGLEAV